MRLYKAEQVGQVSLFGFQQPGIQGAALSLTYQRHERGDVLLHRQQVGAWLIQ